MYALSKGLVHQMVKKDEYNIAILGLDDAGKTVGFCVFFNSKFISDFFGTCKIDF